MSWISPYIRSTTWAPASSCSFRKRTWDRFLSVCGLATSSLFNIMEISLRCQIMITILGESREERRGEGPHDYFISRLKLGRLRLARRHNIYDCYAEGILELRGYQMNAGTYKFLDTKNWIKKVRTFAF